MGMPTECKMPDLSDLQMERLQVRTLITSLIGDPGIERKQSHYRRNFARLVDKAIYEYEVARKAVSAQLHATVDGADHSYTGNRPISFGGSRLYIISYIDHMENCVNAVNRLLKLFDHLKNGKSNPILAGLPRAKKRALGAYSRSLSNVRNAFEHIEEYIHGDKIIEGQGFMLSISDNGDRAIMGPHAMEFSDLARALRQLYEIGVMMFAKQIDPASTGESIEQ